MENPYYREQYENAPSDELKKYYRLTWDKNPFVMGADYDSAKEDEELRRLKLNRSDVEYLSKFAVGGSERMFYRKWLESFDKRGVGKAPVLDGFLD